MSDLYYVLALSAAAVGFALGPIYSRWQSPPGCARRRLLRATRYSIDTFPDGKDGRVTGRVVTHGSVMNAPLSRRECIAYQVRAYERRGRDPWRLIVEESAAEPFFVADATGRALVRASRHTLLLSVDHEDQSDGLCRSTPRIETFLEERGQSSGRRVLRYEEAILREGERVAVLGKARREPDPDVASSAIAYRETASRLVFAELGGDPIIVSDEYVDG